MNILNSILILGFIGVQELLIIFGIVIVIFGASKLPLLGKGLGEGISNFKKGLKTSDDPPVLEKGSDSEE